MILKDLIKFTQEYAEKYPNMLDSEVAITMRRKRRVKGDYYKRHKITSIGFDSLVAKNQLNLGIEEL